MQIIKEDPAEFDVDISYIKSRKVYVHAPSKIHLIDGYQSEGYQVFDVESGLFILGEHVKRRLAPSARLLMTSSTAFGVNDYNIVIYSRSLIWLCSPHGTYLESYRPIVDDINKPVQVRISDFAAAMHQNGSVCYVRIFPLGKSKVYKLELPADGHIIDVYFDHTRLKVLFKQGKYTFFGIINTANERLAYLSGHFHEYLTSDEITLSMIARPGQRYTQCNPHNEPHVNWTYKWTLHGN